MSRGNVPARQTPQPVVQDPVDRAAAPSCGFDDKFGTTLRHHFRAGYVLLYVTTFEANRVNLEIQRVTEEFSRPNAQYKTIGWDFATGFSKINCTDQDAAKYRLPHNALDALGSADLLPPYCVVVMHNLDDFFGDPGVRQRVQNLVEDGLLVRTVHGSSVISRKVIIVSPKEQIHEKLRAVITKIQFELPGEEKLRRVVDALVEVSNTIRELPCAEPLREKLATAMLGLTASEAENCLSLALTEHKAFVPDMLKLIKRSKADIIKKDGVLTYLDEDRTITRDQIGGYDAFLGWLDRQARSFTKEAAALQIDFPRGVIVIGVPGTGKSVMAAGAGRILGLPVFLLNLSAVFGHLVGESEGRIRQALAQVDAQNGAVLFIDEGDKALGGASTSTGDSGVTQRVFGQILTWLADKRSPTFVIMTINRADRLDPELMRAGRFDGMWYTDLPGKAVRRQILEIHLRKRGVEPASLGFDADEWAALVNKTDEYVGAEIEQVVVNARSIAFRNRNTGTPNFEECLEGIAETIPIMKRDADRITKIREFCKQSGGRPVTDEIDRDDNPPKQQRGGRRPLDV